MVLKIRFAFPWCSRRRCVVKEAVEQTDGGGVLGKELSPVN
jgi:hypothetical protein